MVEMDSGLPLISFSSHPALLPFMLFATFLGSIEFFLLLLPAVYWCYDRRLGMRLALILILSQGLNQILKVAFHSPRPYWVSPNIEVQGAYGNFGIPSGHAQDAVCVWGLLALHARRAWTSAAALILILLIGLSRVYLNAHFPIDVVAGWAFGALLLLAFICLESPVSKWLSRRDPTAQILIAFIASLCLPALYALAMASLHGWQMPADWSANALVITGMAIDPFSPEDILEASGMILGIGLGYSALARRGGFRVGGSFVKRLMQYILGMALLVLIWYGLGGIRHDQASIIFYALSYLRALLAGAWVAGLALCSSCVSGWQKQEMIS
jgi:membrane-associated phospholipid phosphatase